LAVNVVNPTLSINYLDGTRSTDGGRDNFAIQLLTPGSLYSGNQTARVDFPIDLSIENDVPNGLVPGFHDAATGGNALTRAVVKAGDAGTDYMYVDTPTSTGSYQVKAAIAGGNSALSALQTVAGLNLRFPAAVTVGKGMNSYSSEAYVERTLNGAYFNGNSASTVNLTCSSIVICNVPATITIPAGGYRTYFTVTGIGEGTTTISANAIGYSTTQDLAVKVVAPELNFSGPDSTFVGSTSSFYVYLTTPGSPYSNNQTATTDMTINLTSSAPGVATMPASLSIPAGSNRSSNTNLTGVGVGTTTLTASGFGLSSATSGLITVNP
jgi:hypothetical protein